MNETRAAQEAITVSIRNALERHGEAVPMMAYIRGGTQVAVFTFPMPPRGVIREQMFRSLGVLGALLDADTLVFGADSFTSGPYPGGLSEDIVPPSEDPNARECIITVCASPEEGEYDGEVTVYSRDLDGSVTEFEEPRALAPSTVGGRVGLALETLCVEPSKPDALIALELTTIGNLAVRGPANDGLVERIKSVLGEENVVVLPEDGNVSGLAYIGNGHAEEEEED